MTHRIATATIAAALLIAPLAACSDSGDAAADAKPSPTRPTPSHTTTKPSPTSDAPKALGASWRIENTTGDNPGLVTVTAISYRQPITGLEPPTKRGTEWGQVEAKLCNHGDETIDVSQFPWSLAFAGGERLKITGLTGGDFPQPEYPMDEPVKSGDCVRGKIMFEVPHDNRPARIIYSTEGSEPLEWRVPAS